MRKVILALVLICGQALADARQVDEYQWEGVERVVAIGDLHGDFDNYLATLEAAGIVDSRGRWAAGETHLVQTGDVPDRGPDTLKIIEHLDKVAKQAKRKGGHVHRLIGNHEAMNVYGDLRYVSEGEYQAFVTRNSERLRDRYYELYLQALQQQKPEEFAVLPEDYREKWNLEHPLGWVEHRRAWDPAWNPEAEYAQRVFDQKVAIRIDDTLFLHGGISGFYCRNTPESLTRMVHDALRNYDPQNAGVLDDPYGPLWYRGLSGEKPAAPLETVDAILEQQGVKQIVVGHTPTSGVIWPRYDGKVVMIDTGISEAYGGHVAWLEITPEGLFAGYPGGKVPLPASDGERIAYLERVVELCPHNASLKRRLELLQKPPEPAAVTAEAGGTADTESEGDAAAQSEGDDGGSGDAQAPTAAVEMPICGTVQ